MKTLPRFRFWVALMLLAGLCVGALRSTDSVRTKERAFTKAAMLEDLARSVIVPAYSNFAVRCRELSVKADEFSSRPDSTSLEQVQAAWITAMLAWRPAQVFRSGPLL